MNCKGEGDPLTQLVSSGAVARMVWLLRGVIWTQSFIGFRSKCQHISSPICRLSGSSDMMEDSHHGLLSLRRFSLKLSRVATFLYSITDELCRHVANLFYNILCLIWPYIMQQHYANRSLVKFRNSFEDLQSMPLEKMIQIYLRAFVVQQTGLNWSCVEHNLIVVSVK